MRRTFANTLVLVAAVYATASFGLLPTPYATGQEQEPEPDAPEQFEAAPSDTMVEHPTSATSVPCPERRGWLQRNSSLNGTQVVNCRPRTYGQPDLFYDYYVPGACGGVPANMYPAPHRVPPVVGQTYYTYQPFMPHELLYRHRRAYYRYYNGGRGLTRTSISWYRPPLRSWLGH
ncbi:MAG: hypothetical protein ACQESR_14685 [Planctomycetota bacterium]